MLKFFLLTLILDAHSGVQIGQSYVEGGPYDTEQECTELTVGAPAEYPDKDGRIKVHECTTDYQLEHPVGVL